MRPLSRTRIETSDVSDKVPQAGRESVLVAVSLLLEGEAPSGSVSAEHVRNVLVRLNTQATAIACYELVDLNRSLAPIFQQTMLLTAGHRSSSKRTALRPASLARYMASSARRNNSI